jgi:glycosyl transferase family 87
MDDMDKQLGSPTPPPDEDDDPLARILGVPRSEVQAAAAEADAEAWAADIAAQRLGAEAGAIEPEVPTAVDSKGRPVGMYVGRLRGPGAASNWRRIANLAAFGLAIVGAILGAITLWYHLSTDPLADIHAYYDAAARLNAGQPLYPPTADPNLNTFYRYPPLLAIVLRPFALLPYGAFVWLWEGAILGAFVWTLRRIGLGLRTYIVLGWLGVPLAWALAIGQAHVFVTLLFVLGTPMTFALAAHLKVFPALIALYWIGRGELGYVVGFLGWLVGLSVVQALLEPEGWRRFWEIATLDQVGNVMNISPYDVSPMLWLVLLGVGIIAALAFARTKFGWWIAVTVATLAPPRLLLYGLSSLLAWLREPEPDTGDNPPEPDAAQALVSSAR